MSGSLGCVFDTNGGLVRLDITFASFFFFWPACALALVWEHFLRLQKKNVMKKKKYSNSESSNNYRKIVPNVIKYCQTIKSKFVFC